MLDEIEQQQGAGHRVALARVVAIIGSALRDPGAAMAVNDNPVSAMASFELFARPALRILGGHRVVQRSVISPTADVDLRRKPDGKLHLLRARLTLEDRASWRACPTNDPESHQLHSTSEANSLILLPDGHGVRAGEQISVLLIDPDRLNSDSSPVLKAPHGQLAPL